MADGGAAGGNEENEGKRQLYAQAEKLMADAKGVACARCHRVKGEGGEVGPDLSDIGGKFDRDGLIEAVLEPSRQIVEGYRSSALAMAAGDRVLPRGPTISRRNASDRNAKPSSALSSRVKAVRMY